MPTPPPDDAARRAFWTSQLEEAHTFLMKVLTYPVEECGEPMVSLAAASKDAGVEVEFSPNPHVQGLPRLYYLRAGQIEGFVGAAREMNQRGWVLKVEDGFRSRTMQKFVGRQPIVFDAILERVTWELGGKTPDPRFMLRRLMTLTALMPKFGTHMSGSAIDISVLERDRRPDGGKGPGRGREVDRGGPYIEMSERTPMLSPFVSATARENRLAITAIMRRHGFFEYPYEFWHYSSGDPYAQVLGNTGKPGRYGAVDWDQQTGKLTPIANPEEPLNSPEEVQQEIEGALRRRKG